MLGIILAQDSDSVITNITTTAPYVAIFTLVVALVRVIVKRSETTDTAAAIAVKAAEERMIVQVDRAIAESESKCNARLEAAEVECAAKIDIVNSKMSLVSRGMRIIAEEYPDNATLQLLISTLNQER